MEIQVTINGEPRALDAGTTVAELVDALSLQGKRIAVEINGAVVPRSTHPTHRLADGDRVEIVHAIGGG
jgi:sulfur carrier protein